MGYKIGVILLFLLHDPAAFACERFSGGAFAPSYLQHGSRFSQKQQGVQVRPRFLPERVDVSGLDMLTTPSDMPSIVADHSHALSFVSSDIDASFLQLQSRISEAFGTGLDLVNSFPILSMDWLDNASVVPVVVVLSCMVLSISFSVTSSVVDSNSAHVVPTPDTTNQTATRLESSGVGSFSNDNLVQETKPSQAAELGQMGVGMTMEVPSSNVPAASVEIKEDPPFTTVESTPGGHSDSIQSSRSTESLLLKGFDLPIKGVRELKSRFQPQVSTTSVSKDVSPDDDETQSVLWNAYQFSKRRVNKAVTALQKPRTV